MPLTYLLFDCAKLRVHGLEVEAVLTVAVKHTPEVAQCDLSQSGIEHRIHMYAREKTAMNQTFFLAHLIGAIHSAVVV